MSIQDTATKQYVSEAEVFADAFNYLIYDGEQVIKPEQLTDMDTTQYVIPYHEDEKGKPEAAQKYRDTLKTLAVKTDDRYTYLVLGIENQSHVHYAMPVRNMLYDAMQLEKQVRDLASQHRKEGKNGTSEEYLSGMKKEDRLSPVITLVINFGGKKWDAPLSLREMYGEQPEKVLPFIQDYRVFMIDPMEMGDNDFQKLNSSLREVLAYIKYQRDKAQMEKLLNEDSKFSCLETNAALVINAMTNAGIAIDPNKEAVNMCEAIRQMVDEGIMLGEKRGEERGKKQGSMNEKLIIARRMLEKNYPMEQVVDLTMLTKQEVEELRKRYRQVLCANSFTNLAELRLHRAGKPALNYLVAEGRERVKGGEAACEALDVNSVFCYQPASSSCISMYFMLMYFFPPHWVPAT